MQQTLACFSGDIRNRCLIVANVIMKNVMIEKPILCCMLVVGFGSP